MCKDFLVKNVCVLNSDYSETCLAESEKDGEDELYRHEDGESLFLCVMCEPKK